MRSFWIVAIGCGLAVGACKKKEPAAKAAPPPATDAAAPAPDAAPVVDPAPAPLTPPIPAGQVGVQIIDLQYGGVTEPGLPAIRDDGGLVAATATGDDGGRGYLDLRLRLLDGTTGAVTQELILADPNETSDAESKDDDGATPVHYPKLEAAVRTRVAEANATFATGTWRPLASTRPAPDREPDDPIVAGDLTFTYDSSRASLALTRAGKKVATHSLAKLVPKAKPPTRPDDEGGCGAEQAYLRAVHLDAPSKRVLIELGFVAGGHNCGAGGQAYAIIPLP